MQDPAPLYKPERPFFLEKGNSSSPPIHVPHRLPSDIPPPGKPVFNHIYISHRVSQRPSASTAGAFLMRKVGRGHTFQTRAGILEIKKGKDQKIKFARLPYGNEADTLRVYGREGVVMVQQRSKAESASR